MAEWKDTEADNGKAKIPGPPAHACSTWENHGKTSSSFFFCFFFQTKCKSRETTGALIKRSSSDVPSCCLSEPHRHREGGSDLH